MQHITDVLDSEHLNMIANNDQLFTQLLSLTQDKDYHFCAVVGYPGGTTIANKKGRIHLDGITIKLGTTFTTEPQSSPRIAGDTLRLKTSIDKTVKKILDQHVLSPKQPSRLSRKSKTKQTKRK